MATFQPIVEADPFTILDWKESMESVSPGGEDIISNEAVDATIVVRIKPNSGAFITQSKIRSAITFALGYSYCDDAAPYKLHRYPGPAHPRYGIQCRPKSVSIRLKTPCGNSLNANFAAFDTSDIVFDNITRIGRYSEAYMTVKFTTLPIRYLTDVQNAALGGLETTRYVDTWGIDPQLELYDADTDRSFLFSQGDLGNPLGKPAPGRIGERVSKVGMTLTIYQVPQSFICNSSGLPTKILAANGCVNSAVFMGQPAYTLLLENPKFDRFLFPFYSLDGPAFHYTITFPFKQFDPKVGVTTVGSGNIAVTDRGWRLFPYRYGGASTASTGLGGAGTTGGAGWYPLRRADSLPGVVPPTASGAAPTVIQEYDFNKLFTHVSIP